REVIAEPGEPHDRVGGPEARLLGGERPGVFHPTVRIQEGRPQLTAAPPLPNLRPMSLPIIVVTALVTIAAATGDTREEALFDAPRDGDIAAVTRLLDSGVPVDARSRYGATALFFACDKQHTDVVRLLLDRGADVNATDTFYKATAFEFVVLRGGREI